MDRFCVSFQYHTGQKVYFLYKNYPKCGIIREVNISIKDMNEYINEVTPIITYKINDNWYKENDLWDDRKQFQKWIDKNLCTRKSLDFENNTVL